MTPPIFSVIDGVQREITSIPVTVDGVERELDSMTAMIDGVAREIFSGKTKWERWSLSKSLCIEEVGNEKLNVSIGDTIVTTTAESNDSDLSVSVSGEYIRLLCDIEKGTLQSFELADSNFAFYSISVKLSAKWFFWSEFITIDRDYIGGKKAYYGNGLYDYSGLTLGYSKVAYLGNRKGSYIDTVSSKDPAAYPDNGEQDGYWYVKI